MTPNDASLADPAPGALTAEPVSASGSGASSHNPLLQPASEADIRRTYLDATVMGYFTYAVGAVTAFLAVALSLSDSEAGLHSSAMAIGMIVSGLSGDRLDRLAGSRRVHFLGLALLVLAVLLVVWTPAFVVTLLGAGLVGLGTGLLLTHANQIAASGGGSLARLRISRATLISTVAALLVPVFIGLGVAMSIGWGFVAIPALVILGVGLAVTRKRTERPMPSRSEVSGHLPQAYWMAWLLAASFIAIEFIIVFWGGTLVARQTGVTLATATLVLSALSAGVIVGRIGLSVPAVSKRDPIWIIRGGIALSLFSALLAWVSPSFEFSMVAFFLTGLGLASLFPLGAAITMATAPLQASLASGRLVLATGLAILVAPLLLGVMADVTGVVAAWLAIPGLCLASLAVTVPVARGRDRASIVA